MNNTPPCFAFFFAGIAGKVAAVMGFFANYSNAFAGISFAIAGLVGIRTLWVSFKKKGKE